MDVVGIPPISEIVVDDTLEEDEFYIDFIPDNGGPIVPMIHGRLPVQIPGTVAPATNGSERPTAPPESGP